MVGGDVICVRELRGKWLLDSLPKFGVYPRSSFEKFSLEITAIDYKSSRFPKRYRFHKSSTAGIYRHVFKVCQLGTQLFLLLRPFFHLSFLGNILFQILSSFEIMHQAYCWSQLENDQGETGGLREFSHGVIMKYYGTPEPTYLLMTG